MLSNATSSSNRGKFANVLHCMAVAEICYYYVPVLHDSTHVWSSCIMDVLAIQPYTLYTYSCVYPTRSAWTLSSLLFVWTSCDFKLKQPKSHDFFLVLYMKYVNTYVLLITIRLMHGRINISALVNNWVKFSLGRMIIF